MIPNKKSSMSSTQKAACIALVLFGAAFSSGCLIVSESHSEAEVHHSTTECYDECYDYEVCETYCDHWECWDECWWETTCDTYCEEVIVYEETTTEYVGAECYSDLDCGGDTICVGNECVVPGNTDAEGLSGLCQVCETNDDCTEDGALCIRLNFDQATSTGEKVCTRSCEYNHECPSGFECINVSSEVGTSPQCLPVLTEFEKRTCNPSPELECVRASDCGVGESCVSNECVAPESAECSSQNPCSNGETCHNFKCVGADEAECVTRADCASGEICIDGSCAATAEEGCVFNEECDGGMCVDGECLSTCSADTECATGERCREGLCEPLECRRSADCSAGEVCVDAKCETLCDSTGGCDFGYECNDHNYCEADATVECRSNAECDRDQLCNAGICETPCTCNQQCGEGEVCNLDAGVCEDPNAAPNTPAPSCEDDCDCPSGLACVDGACQ